MFAMFTDVTAVVTMPMSQNTSIPMMEVTNTSVSMDFQIIHFCICSCMLISCRNLARVLGDRDRSSALRPTIYIVICNSI